MYLVVGLGNPGAKYAGNRHNIGFMVVDELARKHGAGAYKEKFKGELTKVALRGDELALLKPLTYMNLSGECVQRAMQFFKVPLARLIVVHDELDLPFGTVRLKEGGGTAGHNGLRSIVQHGGGPGFLRVRIGIDRPRTERAVESWVLSDFDGSERAELPDVISRAVEAIEALLEKGLGGAMNAVHGAGGRKGGKGS